MSLIRADAINIPLQDATVDLIVTSPPYFALRSYTDGGEHYDGQIGSEPTPQDFLEALWVVTAECARVLKPSGSIWVNLGDKYATTSPVGSGGKGEKSMVHGKGSNLSANTQSDGRRVDNCGIPAKSLMGLPWRYAIGCIDHLGLILRAEVIWSKPNGLPESVTDRVRRSHEQWFHLTKSPRYYAAVDEVREAHATDPTARPTWRERKANGEPMRAGLAGAAAVGNVGMAGNPLGKLPGSVWTIDSESWELDLSGPIRFCPRCGRDLTAGSSPADSTPRDTGSSGSPTSATDEPTGSCTSSRSGPSPTDSPSTTCAGTERAAIPSTSTPSPSESTSCEATPPPRATRPRLDASTATTSPTTTPSSGKTGDESAACVCETGRVLVAPPSVWVVPSEPLKVPDHLGVDHFAAYPQEFPRRIILGWSPPGICTRCGDGRRPVVEKGLRQTGTMSGRNKMESLGRHKGDPKGQGGWDEAGYPSGVTEATITGYACGCPEPDAPTRPAVVLDPFSGTGTTVGVARTLGRYGVGLDLSSDYLRLAQWRVFQSGHFAKTVTRTNGERRGAGRGDLVNLPAVAGEDQLDLFGGAA